MAMANFNGFCDGSEAQPEKQSTPFFSPPQVASTPNAPFSNSQRLGQHHIQESSQSRYSEMEVSTSGYIQRSPLRQAPLCSYCRRPQRLGFSGVKEGFCGLTSFKSASLLLEHKMSESLTSISNQNGDPAHSIVIANKKIMDTDLEQKGQNIKIQNPRAITDVYQLEEKLQSALNGLRHYKKLSALASSRLPPARTTSFIVLVPLIVFCARCIIGASYARVFGTSRLEPVDKREGERYKFKSGHWRSALRDIRELDGLDCESPIDSTSPSEDEQISVEDLSHAYKKLDQDYQKFLSECGLSKWGYWRGGTRRDLNRNE